MKDSQYLGMITKNSGPGSQKPGARHPWRNKLLCNYSGNRLPVGLSKLKAYKGKRELEVQDAEETRDYFMNLYRNCKE